MNDEPELHLPRIRGGLQPPVRRSIDEIDAWIEHDCRLFMNREQYEREKRESGVDVPFVLKSGRGRLRAE